MRRRPSGRPPKSGAAHPRGTAAVTPSDLWPSPVRGGVPAAESADGHPRCPGPDPCPGARAGVDVVVGGAACRWSSRRSSTRAPAGRGASVLPLAWLLAGALALRARPDHAGALLMTAVGTMHLGAFALSLTIGGPWRRRGRPRGRWRCSPRCCTPVASPPWPCCWPTTPTAPPAPWFSRVAFGAAVVLPLVDAVTQRSCHWWSRATCRVPAPGPLPLVQLPFALFAVPLLVVAGAACCCGAPAAWRGSRRQLTWAIGAGGLLGLLLLATPAAGTLLPGWRGR